MSRNLNVLVVDDDEPMCRMFKSDHTQPDVDIDYVTCSLKAIKKVKSSSYDLIFLDIIMLYLDGVQALEQIRKFNKDVKVVIMTGFSVKEMLERAKEFDVYAVLEKPMGSDVIKRIIGEIKQNVQK